VAGTASDLSATLINRNQWVGVSGAPNYQSINVQGKLHNRNIGVGMQINNQSTGPFSSIAFLESFSYQVKLNQVTKLSLGVQGSLNSVRVNSGMIKSEVANDVANNNFAAASLVPDAGLGAHLYGKDYFVGLSILHLMQSRFDLNASGQSTARYTRQYFLSAGYNRKINENLSIKPSMLFRYAKSSPVNFGLTAMTVYKSKYEAGLSFQTSKTPGIKGMNSQMNVIAQYEINSFLKFGYAYNIYLNPIGRKTLGTHEMVFIWDIKATKKSNKLVIDGVMPLNNADEDNSSDNSKQNN
jgi:type IX secretion system PorP/SprF family membrane protein